VAFGDAPGHRLSGPGHLSPFVPTLLSKRDHQHDPPLFGKEERDALGLLRQIEPEFEEAVTERPGSWHPDRCTMLTQVLDPGSNRGELASRK
jgi:hypothetical protein